MFGFGSPHRENHPTSEEYNSNPKIFQKFGKKPQPKYGMPEK